MKYTNETRRVAARKTLCRTSVVRNKMNETIIVHVFGKAAVRALNNQHIPFCLLRMWMLRLTYNIRSGALDGMKAFKTEISTMRNGKA